MSPEGSNLLESSILYVPIVNEMSQSPEGSNLLEYARKLYLFQFVLFVSVARRL